MVATWSHTDGSENCSAEIHLAEARMLLIWSSDCVGSHSFFASYSCTECRSRSFWTFLCCKAFLSSTCFSICFSQVEFEDGSENGSAPLYAENAFVPWLPLSFAMSFQSFYSSYAVWVWHVIGCGRDTILIWWWYTGAVMYM